MMSKFKDVFETYKHEMKSTLEHSASLVSATAKGKPGYANLNHLNTGSPGSDISELDDAMDLEELLAQGAKKGPRTPPGTIYCTIFSLAGFIFLIIIGTIVGSNSIYINVKPPEGKKRSSLAGSIFLAAFLYLCTFGTSLTYFLKARRAQKVYQLSLDVHTTTTTTTNAQ